MPTVKKLVFGVLVCLCFFALLELVQRIRHPQKGFRYSFNAQGYRGPEFSKHKGAATRRIFFIGGSTTFGTPLPAEQAFPYLAGSLLNERMPDLRVETVNAAKPFKTSYWEVERLRESLVHAPDVFVVMSGYNDAALVYQKLGRLDERGDILVMPRHLRWDRRLMSISVFYTTLREKIALILHGNPSYATLAPGTYSRGSDAESEAWFRYYPGYFAANLESMIGLAAGHGARLLLLKAPLGAQRRRQQPLYEKAYTRLMQETMRVAQASATPVLDLDPVFPPERQGALISHDGLHFTEAGNKAIADAVAAFFVAHRDIFFRGADQASAESP